MKSRRLNVSEDPRTILGKHSRVPTSNSTNALENSEVPVPIDVMMDIFSRLSAKSIARCSCVSKLWFSILRLPYFTELCLTKSSARPKLLFACVRHRELIVFLTPQPQHSYERSSRLAATFHMKIPCGDFCDIISPIHGLVFVRDVQKFKLVSVICNPTTRQTLTLPKPKTKKRLYISSYFGYDPMEKQFKVLLMTERDGISDEHQVLTLLGTKKLSWSMIECCIPHFPRFDGICINGVLYYRASVDIYSNMSMIVCFDVKSETFSFIKVMEPFINAVASGATLINYNGKLGSVLSEGRPYICGRDRRFEMWILKDSDKHEWSKFVYEMPPRWQHISERKVFRFIGVIGTTNEIVLSSSRPPDRCYVLYYSLERKTIIRVVEIQGMGAIKRNGVIMFLDHVEDVRLT
ncbi:PREDICTED: F-box protein DOR-like [Camelina sativa]|uniref:F-box protein DOR-like n=1 Tax=Camelina sativa TaxID=90675 RepID=A0ABM1RQZ3_CAMSA|nr:PREDICTED: F-box protein DOR-like [Camelina sativa]